MNDHIRFLIISCKWGESTPMGVFDKKKDAVSALKKRGYKYNKKQDLYYFGRNIEDDVDTIARIDCVAYNKLGYGFR